MKRKETQQFSRFIIKDIKGEFVKRNNDKSNLAWISFASEN